jgi:2-methylcitrate dehydratase
MAQVSRIEVEIFDVAFNIIGGGQEGDKTLVRTKEQAAHSLHYLLAVALLDGQVMPEQFVPERIQREDVQDLLRKVAVHASLAYSQRFPAEVPCRVTIQLQDRRAVAAEKRDYQGFLTRPMAWNAVVQKFERLSRQSVLATTRRDIVDAVANLENIQAVDLARLLDGEHVVAAPGKATFA